MVATARPLDQNRFSYSALMTRELQRPRPQVEVISASAEQSPILANLLELYVHDFSAFLDVELGPDGRFGYPNLDLYWSKPGRHPFLIRVDGKIAGFLLVKKGSEFSGNHSVLDMAEFFILRRYRRQGIGTEVARESGKAVHTLLIANRYQRVNCSRIDWHGRSVMCRFSSPWRDS